MKEWLLPLAVGAATGVLSGFGVGGGTLLLVYMTAFAGLDQRLAQGINLLYFLPAGLMALPAHIKNGCIEKKVLAPAIGAGCCAPLWPPGRPPPRRWNCCGNASADSWFWWGSQNCLEKGGKGV